MSSNRGRWMALIAALLGWMFDGFEMGLFPVVSNPALRDLLHIVGTPGAEDKALIAQWNGLAIAGFLIGAATGGVLFGWLGDRLGRVRAMTVSILTYALCSGLAAFTTHPWQIVAVRFIAALGMGGEWSLGVALVMEIWGGRSRALLAGVIGAAANLGFAVAAVLSFGVASGRVPAFLNTVANSTGLPNEWVTHLTANDAWRMLMLAGMLPAVITFFIMISVPESESWRQEQKRGATSSWARRDLLGVLVGAIAALGILAVWLPQIGVSPAIRLILTAAALIVVIGGYLYPVFRYMGRSAQTPEFRRQTLTRMGLGACLSGIALLGTWGSIQWATNWVDLFPGRPADAKQWTQFWSAMGAVVSTAIAPFVCEWLGRRITYAVLCVAAFAATVFFYQGGARYDSYFLFRVFLGGAFSATFYGFLPLYLPELFATRVRATGQGFSYNFGRIIAAIGALQTGALTGWVQSVELASWMDKGIPAACTLLSLVYFVGVAIIWLAPETKGKPLPE